MAPAVRLDLLRQLRQLGLPNCALALGAGLLLLGCPCALRAQSPDVGFGTWYATLDTAEWELVGTNDRTGIAVFLSEEALIEPYTERRYAWLRFEYRNHVGFASNSLVAYTMFDCAARTYTRQGYQGYKRNNMIEYAESGDHLDLSPKRPWPGSIESHAVRDICAKPVSLAPPNSMEYRPGIR